MSGQKKEQLIKYNDDDNPSVLYLINGTSDDGDSFKVCKAGSYFYINAKLMFDSLGVDYVNKTIIYDMSRLQGDEGNVYKMIKRELDQYSAKGTKKASPQAMLFCVPRAGFENYFKILKLTAVYQPSRI